MVEGYIRTLNIFLIQEHRQYSYPTNFQFFYFRQVIDSQGP